MATLVSLFLIIAGAGFLVLVCAKLAYGQFSQDNHQDGTPQPVTYASTPPTLDTPSSTPSASVSSQPVTPPQAPVSSHNKVSIQAVQPAQPNQLVIPTLGINADVGQVATSKVDGKIGVAPPEENQPDLDRAYFWTDKDYSHLPSSSSGTVFIVGHTCHLVGCKAVFNPLQKVATGATVEVGTPEGVFTYVVTKVATRQGTAGTSPLRLDDYSNVPGKLVLVTCKLRSDGASQTDNTVVWAQLEGAIAKS